MYIPHIYIYTQRSGRTQVKLLTVNPGKGLLKMYVETRTFTSFIDLQFALPLNFIFKYTCLLKFKIAMKEQRQRQL